MARGVKIMRGGDDRQGREGRVREEGMVKEVREGG